MARRFFYSGDVSIEHGGMFYCLDSWQWGYVDALRVVPVSDAGGPDNVFWLEKLTINLRTGAELDSILQTSGWTREDIPKGAASRHFLVQAHVSYGAYDCESVATARIGPACPYSSHRECPPITHYLRASVDLHKLARRMAHGRDIGGCVKPMQGPHKGAPA